MKEGCAICGWVADGRTKHLREIQRRNHKGYHDLAGNRVILDGEWEGTLVRIIPENTLLGGNPELAKVRFTRLGKLREVTVKVDPARLSHPLEES